MPKIISIEKSELVNNNLKENAHILYKVSFENKDVYFIFYRTKNKSIENIYKANETINKSCDIYYLFEGMLKFLKSNKEDFAPTMINSMEEMIDTLLEKEKK